MEYINLVERIEKPYSDVETSDVIEGDIDEKIVNSPNFDLGFGYGKATALDLIYEFKKEIKHAIEYDYLDLVE